MRFAKPRYVIYAPPYNDGSGGTMVLHRLCDELNRLGECAALRPMQFPRSISQRLAAAFSQTEYATAPELATPVVTDRVARNTDIVVYPDIVPDNPMRARNVVRWLLNRPCLLGRTVNAGPSDLFFCYDNRCDEPALTGGIAPMLFLFSLNTGYELRNHGPRHGSCYMLRKGRGRRLQHDLSDSIQVDGLSYDELVQIFNEREYFYCYDEMTSYLQFAAICGCTSVVIPKLYANRAEYVAAYPLSRYGVAYGLGDTAHAIATRHMVLDYLRDLENSGQQSVVNFISITRTQFGFSWGNSA